MNPTYYSLHIGVNKYHPDSGVPHLGGCANDIHNLGSTLEEILGEGNLNGIILLDEEANYQNIIDHFGEKHLLKAEKDDVVIIQYSGHGAREKAAPEFDDHFPDGFSETLVCYDSRVPNGKDLADKELTVLVERIAEKGAHVVLIIDSCHSGSITKEIFPEEIKTRQFLAKTDTRPYENYLNGYFAEKYPDGKGLSIPNSKHIVLSACRKNETALEMGGQGFFTSNLVEVLKEINGNISYTDLFTKCIVSMARRSQHQHPQFDTSGFFNSHEGFLKRGTGIQESFWQMSDKNNKWKIKCGAIHGLPVTPDKHPVFEIFKNKESQGHATAFKVNVDSCMVNLDFEPERGTTYDARLISLPDAPVMICLEGNAAGNQRVMAALEKNYVPSIFFQLEKGVNTNIKVVANDDAIEIIRKEDDALIRRVEGDMDEAVFKDVFGVLNTIAQWEKLLWLDNANTTLKRDNVQIILRLLDDDGKTIKELVGDEIYLSLFQKGEEERPANFQIDILNRDTVNDLHATLLYFSEDFEIYPFYEDVIPANSKAIAIDKNEEGDFYDFRLEGEKQSFDYFKLFVSTKQVSTYLLEKAKTFEIGERVSYFKEKSLGGLKKKVGNRKLDKKIFIEDWYTKTMTIYSVASEKEELEYSSNFLDDEMTNLMKLRGKKSQSATVDNSSEDLRSIPDENVIKILPHGSLKPTLHVSPLVKEKSANAADNALIDILQKQENRDSHIMNLAGTQRSTEQFPILEVSNIGNTESLKEEPLKIQLAGNEEEGVIAFTFDGEHIIPVGEASKDRDGNSIISISEVPDGKERNIGRALKFVFFKLVLKQEDVNQLRWVEYVKDKAKRRSWGLYDKVEEAENILLCVHGIIGDTKVMANRVRPAFDNQVYDLVLTFDYENLNTPIGETASQLKEVLADVGIKKGSGKNLTILAHSMGGLVSRSLIEQLDGKQFVKKLVMAGTPNNGSNVSKVTDYRNLLTTLLTLAANTGIGIPAAATILGVLQYSKNLTVTLEQMHAEKSQFLKTLNESADPGVPYQIIAGNFKDYMTANPEDEKLMGKALKFASNLFFDDLNDIAVSLESITHIPDDRIPIPDTIRLPGHHLNYFTYQPCIEKINQWLAS